MTYRKLTFSFITFNHEEMKKSTLVEYLIAERKVFHDITESLMNVNIEVLPNLTKQMTNKKRVKPETE